MKLPTAVVAVCPKLRVYYMCVTSVCVTYVCVLHTRVCYRYVCVCFRSWPDAGGGDRLDVGGQQWHRYAAHGLNMNSFNITQAASFLIQVILA